MQKFLSGIGGILFSLLFVAAGIFCLVMGVNRLTKLNSGKLIETQATITNIESTTTYDADTNTDRIEYQITVEYTVDGKKYVSLLGETPKEFHEGMELTVLYDVDNPSEVVLPGKTGAFIMMGLGVVGILAGGVVFLKKLRGR